MVKRILNVGCGDETYGTHFVDLYPTRKKVIKCDVDRQRLPFPSNYFDIVYSRNLFEHLTNPLFALKEMKRVLKPRGRLILITDNAHYWTFAVGTVHAGGYEKELERSGRLEDRHYFLVNDHHLKNWMRKIGLKVVKIEFIEENPYRGKYKFLKKVINSILSLIPKFNRFAYQRIKVIAVKSP